MSDSRNKNPRNKILQVFAYFCNKRTTNTLKLQLNSKKFMHSTNYKHLRAVKCLAKIPTMVIQAYGFYYNFI